MKLVFVAAGLLASIALGAQDVQSGLKKPRPKPVPAAAGFVTEADAKAVFARAEKMIRRITKSTAKVEPIALSGNQPISRAKTVMQFKRLYEVVRPQVKVTPRPVKVDIAIIRMSEPTKAVLIKLVKMGAIGNHSHLAAGPLDKLTPADFGDSLGFFLARMAQMTHTPSSEWSPPLMSDK
jgi:hypothetical protein